MNWTSDFYTKQAQWSGAYAGPPTDWHRRKLALLEKSLGAKPRLLELGAGGGQFALLAADLGYDVTAVERVPVLAAHARALALSAGQSGVTVVEQDFYEAEFEQPFDLVCYWDGFGIGSDADQRALLRRVANWITSAGRALIDVYTPWYWARMSGRQMDFGEASRRYGFEAESCRLLDTWWHQDTDAASKMIGSPPMTTHELIAARAAIFERMTRDLDWILS